MLTKRNISWIDYFSLRSPKLLKSWAFSWFFASLLRVLELPRNTIEEACTFFSFLFSLLTFLNLVFVVLDLEKLDWMFLLLSVVLEGDTISS